MKNNRSRRPSGRSGRLTVTFLCAILGVGFFAPTAIAAQAPANIHTISVSSASPDGSRLTYTKILDAPVTQGESDEIRQEMSQQLAQQELLVTSKPVQPFEPFQIACDKKAVQDEPTQGKLDLKLECSPAEAVLDWGFKLAPTLEATVRGVVIDSGMRWFRNGSSKPANPPHRGAPNYRFHGSFDPVFVGDNIKFQDTFTWRNNRGGTTVLLVARSANLG